jgi:pyruvate,water dikinase
MAENTIVLWFEDMTSENINLVGSKCGNLGEMINKIKVPVPDGFAITTEAFDRFMKETDSEEEISKYLARFPPKDIAQYDEAGDVISQIILSKQIPRELQDIINQAYEELSQKCEVGDIAVSVRSSGVMEDLPEASFAGQYESFLNIKGKVNLIEKVKECWASLFTARAISYRIKNELPVLAGGMSVGVQKMVNVRSAGVCFTVDASTGEDTWVIIEGSWGAGEGIVQGRVIPDRYFINKETLKVDEREISQKMVQISLKGEGIMEEDVPPEIQNSPSLGDEEAIRVAELAKKVESSYGIPQDIEWAIDRDLHFPENIFLLQTRPVTALAKKKSTSERTLDTVIRCWTKQ